MLDPAIQIAEEMLGPLGRMISSSKTLYRNAHPDHVAIFNANVCVAGKKVWYGDLDLTTGEQHLRDFATRVEAVVHVLYEHDARFRHEREPRLHEAVYWIEPGEEPRFDETLVRRGTDDALHWTRWEAR